MHPLGHPLFINWQKEKAQGIKEAAIKCGLMDNELGDAICMQINFLGHYLLEGLPLIPFFRNTFRVMSCPYMKLQIIETGERALHSIGRLA